MVEERIIKFKHVFKLGKDIGEVVEHIVGISKDWEFGKAYLHIECNKVIGVNKQEMNAFVGASIRLTVGDKYDAETPATWCSIFDILKAGDELQNTCEHKPATDFKNAWIRFALSRYWDYEEVECVVYGWVSYKKIEEVPPETPPEIPPEEPEKPTEPFDLGKWLEWALRKILRDKEPPACTPHNTWLLASILTVIYMSTLADIDYWCSILGLIALPSILFGEFWRVFTYMWLHYPTVQIFDGMVIPHAHIALNILFLWVFGDNVECRVGYGRYIAYYIICGVVAGLGQVAWLHIIGIGFEPILIIGASGAISGILGLYLILFPKNTVIFMEKEMRAWYFILLWFLSQIAMLFQLKLEVAVAAHITGFITGAILGLLEKRIQ